MSSDAVNFSNFFSLKNSVPNRGLEVGHVQPFLVEVHSGFSEAVDVIFQLL